VPLPFFFFFNSVPELHYRKIYSTGSSRLPSGTYVLTDNSATASGSVYFGYWQGQNGTPQWDGKQTKLTLQSVQQYFDLWAGWRAKGYVPPASVSADYAETNESSSAMIAGKTAVVQVWSNGIANYQAATRDELDLIELPNAAVTNGLWGQMSQMMGINKKTKNPAAAVKFLNYYTNDARAWAILRDTYGMPVTPAGRAAMTDNASDAIKKQIAYLDVAGKHVSTPNPNMPNDTEWNSGLHLIAQNVAYGRLASAAGAQQVLDLINRLTLQDDRESFCRNSGTKTAARPAAVFYSPSAFSSSSFGFPLPFRVFAAPINFTRSFPDFS